MPNLKSHFSDLGIEELEVESRRLFVTVENSLLFVTSIVLLCDRISDYEMDEFVKTLQK